MKPAFYIRKHVLGLTQEQMAAKLNVTQAAVSRWESKGRFPAERQEAIRALGKDTTKAWDDSWFFEVPTAPKPVKERQKAA